MTSNSLAAQTPASPVSLPSAICAAGEKHTYSQILKSTALIGGSSLVNVAFGVIRTKAMALFLGPAGVGLMGLYGSIADVTQSFAGMGIQNSGVRQIAEAVGSGDTERIARTVIVLRRMAILFGVLGASLLLIFARPVSHLTFGGYEQTTGVALLSVAVFCREVSAGQSALIQGMRRISALARIGVLGALFGTLIGVPLVYFFRERGVVPSLVAVAAVSILTSWWYSRQIVVQKPPMTMSQVGWEAAALLKLGFAFMASGFLTMGAAYAIRIIVVRTAGLEAAGLYQSAWALGGLYVGFILQAMGADFYPRLTAVSTDNVECNRLVNEQAHVSLLLAGPGVIATLTLAPLVIALFYSARFAPAADVLRWVCLGMMLRVIAWPMGFIIVAKGRQAIYFWTEVAATLVHVSLAWLCVTRLGVVGSGLAFFGLYVWHGLFIYVIVRRVSGFRWSSANLKTAAVLLPITALVFGGFFILPLSLATVFGIIGVLSTGVYSVRMLLRLVPLDQIPGPLARVLVPLGLSRRA